MKYDKNMNTRIVSFTDLHAWQFGHQLVVSIYAITRKFPKEETYSLVDQMRRAASSVTSNIAEGFGRQSLKEKIQFFFLAQGSLTELKNQILIAKDVGYLNKKDYDVLVEKANTTHQLLQGLITKTKSFISHTS
jgi:four helix bundle protein